MAAPRQLREEEEEEEARPKLNHKSDRRKLGDPALLRCTLRLQYNISALPLFLSLVYTTTAGLVFKRRQR